MRLLVAALAFSILAGGRSSEAPQPSRYAVVVSGASGGGEFSDRFWEWSSKMVLSLKEQLRFPDENLFFLTENPDRDPSLVTARAVKSELIRLMDILEDQVRPNDLVFLLLLGHGNFDGSNYRYNLKGPDLTGSELSAILDRFLSQRIVLVCTTPASGALIPKLSRKNRILLTATKNGYEGNETVFARFFVEAFQTRNADLDKNKQVSLLEAYSFTRRKVKEWYEENNWLATEHSRLDDNGDGVGSASPATGSGEGSFAGRVTLGEPVEALSQTAPDSTPTELQALRQRRLDLEAAIQELKTQKETLAPGQYEKRLETLLVELARTTRAFKRMTSRSAPKGSPSQPGIKE